MMENVLQKGNLFVTSMNYSITYMYIIYEGDLKKNLEMVNNYP